MSVGIVTIGLSIADEAVLQIVGLEGFALVVGGADATTLHLALGFAALIPAGIAAGWLANRHIPQKHFDAVVTVLMLVTSAHFCFG